MPQDFWDDRNAHLQHLPDHVLFDVARNGSADRSYRKCAVEILVVRKSPKIKHPELADLVAELEIELDGIQFEYLASTGSGPMIASITTETMFSDGSPRVEFHTEEVPAVLPENSGSVLVVKPKKPKKEPKSDVE